MTFIAGLLVESFGTFPLGRDDLSCRSLRSFSTIAESVALEKMVRLEAEYQPSLLGSGNRGYYGFQLIKQNFVEKFDQRHSRLSIEKGRKCR
jgi:hypothetical protein